MRALHVLSLSLAAVGIVTAISFASRETRGTVHTIGSGPGRGGADSARVAALRRGGQGERTRPS